MTSIMNIYITILAYHYFVHIRENLAIYYQNKIAGLMNCSKEDSIQIGKFYENKD